MDRQFVIAVFMCVVVAAMVMLIGMAVLYNDQINSPGFAEFIKQKDIDCHICLESHGINYTINNSMNVWGSINNQIKAEPYTDCNSNCTVALEDGFS